MRGASRWERGAREPKNPCDPVIERVALAPGVVDKYAMRAGLEHLGAFT